MALALAAYVCAVAWLKTKWRLNVEMWLVFQWPVYVKWNSTSTSRRGEWNGRGLVWSVHGLFILFGWPWSFDPARWFFGGHAWVSFLIGKDGDLGLFIIGGGYRCFIPYVVGKVNVGVGRCYVPKRVGTGGTGQKEAGVEKEADDDMIWVNFIRFKLYRLSSFSLVN